MGLSFQTYCDPLIGQTLRSDSSGVGGDVGVLGATAANSAILGGPIAAPTHTNNADLSVILMGDTNTINTFGVGVNGCYNTIGNGHLNIACGCYTNIFNGESNHAVNRQHKVD